MKKVYILFGYDSTERDDWVESVFSTKKKAEKALEFLDKLGEEMRKDDLFYPYHYYLQERTMNEFREGSYD